MLGRLVQGRVREAWGGQEGDLGVGALQVGN